MEKPTGFTGRTAQRKSGFDWPGRPWHESVRCGRQISGACRRDFRRRARRICAVNCRCAGRARSAAVTGQQPVPIVERVVPASAKVPVLDHAFDTDEDMPRELRERLEQDGFIRIDAGFFRHHRFALRDQIERVDSNTVGLNVSADELIKH